MATIREIAKEAGVSIATVSNVFNNKGVVKPETAALVLEVADRLSYRPNLNARSLKTGSSRTVGILTEDLTVFNTPEIVDGIAAACGRYAEAVHDNENALTHFPPPSPR